MKTIAKVEGVLPTPAPEALVVDLGDAESGIVKLRLTWWTKSPRQHEMIASHDRVLTAIGEALRQLAVNRTADTKPRAA